MNLLSITEAARRLGVSSATIRNWSRAGYLDTAGSQPISFREEDVAALEERIRTNRFNRLRKRANKSAAQEYKNPEIKDPIINSDLTIVLDYIAEHNEDPAKALFISALYFLQAEGEVVLPAFDDLPFDKIVWKRKSVHAIMQGWLKRIKSPIHLAPPGVLDSFLAWKDCEDRLGLLYQGLSSVGTKSRSGAYFTPGNIIDDSLASFTETPSSFLDPCCGTGRYLMRAAARWNIDPHHIHGFDSDPVSVDIARLNLLLVYRDRDFIPNIECLDSLQELANGQPDCVTNHLSEGIDAIATNPPWGGCKNTARHKNLISLIKSGESFSLFLEKSLHLTRSGGMISFLLPESVLKIKTHADIRRLLLEKTRIKKIAILGRIFSGVFTPIVRIDMIKEKPPANWPVVVEGKESSHQAEQERFIANPNYAFDVAVTPRDTELIRKIFSIPCATLKNNAEWALGIVTGDNQACVLHEPGENTEPILRGRDIFKFAPRAPRCHIEFKPERFQQVAPEHRYRVQEKLIYRFISDRLIFAYDDKRMLTLNSANILIPHLPGLSIKTTMAFLNSRVFQFLFIKKFRTRKVLRSDLETLPFPVLNKAQVEAIDAQVELCMGGEYKPAEVLDAMVFDVFGLDAADIMALEASLDRESARVVL